MRLFLAVDFSDEGKSVFFQTAMGLKQMASQGSFTRKENFHLTLSFLGEVYPDRLPELKALMEEAGRAVRRNGSAAGFPARPEYAFRLVPSRIGVFRGKGGDIYYIGFRQSPDLLRLYEELTKRLVNAGFLKESTAFKAHLTLGRRIRLKPGAHVNSLMEPVSCLAFPVSEFYLMKSERLQGVLTYTPLYRTGLI